jgi:hypothetical protein
MKYSYVVLAALALLILVVLLGGSNEKRVVISPGLKTQTSEEESALESVPHPVGDDAGLHSPASLLSSHRVAVALDQSLKGVVLTKDGSPLRGAQVSWSPAGPERAFAAIAQGTWREQESVQRNVETDSKGQFKIPFETTRADGFLWATLLGHEARFHRVQEGGPSSPIAQPLRFELPTSADINVTLERADGEPIGAYKIIERGVGNFASQEANADPENLAALAFLRTRDGRGVAATESSALPSIDDLVWLHAETATLASDQVSTGPGSQVELKLRPAFTLAVRLNMGSGELNTTSARASIYPLDGEESQVTFLSLAADGTAEIKIPVADCTQYEVQLAGGGFAMDSKTFPQPAAGGRVEIEFIGQRVKDVSLRYSDQNGTPAEGIKALISWTDDEGQQNESARMYESDDTGCTVLHSLPAGPFWLIYTSENHVDGFRGPFHYSQIEGGHIDVEVFALASVTGLVLANGKAQTAYRLFSWEASASPDTATELDLKDAVDKEGRFEVKLPMGRFSLMAWAQGFSNSPAILVEVAPVESPTIELVLRESIRATGRLLDELSREPVLNATLTAGISSGGVNAAFVGEVSLSQADGTFTIDGYSPVEKGTLVIDAQGYASASAEVSPRGLAPGEDLQFGDVLLSRYSHVAIALSSTDITDWSGYYVQIGNAPSHSSTQYATRDGLLTFSGVTPCRPYYTLYLPDGHAVLRHSEPLIGTGPWEVTIDLDTGLSLEVLAPADERYGDGPLYVSVRGATGPATNRTFFGKLDLNTRTCLLKGLPPGTHSVAIIDSQSAKRACGQVEMVEGQVSQVTIVPGAPKLNVLVRDSSGAPVPHLYVTASPQGQTPLSGYTGNTNQDGLADVGMIPFDEGFLTIINDVTNSCMSHVPFSLEEGLNQLNVTWNTDAILAVRVIDAGTPLGSAAIQIDTVLEPFSLFSTELDSGGTFTSGGVSQAEYTISVTSPWVWPQMRSLFPSDGTTVDVEFRRRGDLRLRIQSATGQALAGIPIQLTSVEFSTESVLSWLTAGLVKAGVSGLQTDCQGALIVSGLPNGKFTWDAPSVGLSGMITVPPLGVGEGLGLVE